MSARLRSLALVAVGIAIGVALAALGASLLGERPAGMEGAGAPAGSRLWTCSMHPQIRLGHPGRCPICGMELVPVRSDGEKPGHARARPEDHLTLSEHARRMASVEAAALEERQLFKEIRTAGKVEFDETRVRHITARVGGRVDQVFANFPGTGVKEGDHLVSIYSPDLVITQEEFLINSRYEKEQEAAGGRSAPGLSTRARERLHRWGVTDDQLQELARTGTAQTHVVVQAKMSGTVVEKNIREGQYVREGDSLYTIADLRYVWLILDIYEADLSWVRFGQTVQVTLESEPSAVVTGTVAFIDPVLNEATRTVRTRAILENEAGRFKPGMYAQAVIRVPILPDGKPAPTGLEGKFACPMHPYVVADGAGKCSECGMPLELVPGKADPELARNPPGVLAVPAEAVLTTGRRWLVFVEAGSGEFRLVEPRLGPRAGDYYPVLGGLKAGERVVTRGNFLLDSQFQITGKPSLLYPEGIAGGGTGHEGHGAGEPLESSGSKGPAER